MDDFSSTIYGEMTFPGKSALRAIRVSGNLSITALSKLFKSKRNVVDNPQKLSSGILLDSKGREIDSIMAVYFKAPKSYTGEDVAEFFCHGSAGVISSLSKSLEKLGIRKAKNGEFSFRSYINGKMGIKEAKRIKKIMDSETPYEAQLSFLSEDKVEKEISSLKDEIVRVVSLWEGRLDFVEDVPKENKSVWFKELRSIKAGAENLQGMAKRGEQLKSGFKVALFGRTNSGKSSLFNNLLGKERAIVTPHPGTTRDVLEEKLEIDGFPILFYDTAGARKKSVKIEKKGIERAIEVARKSDLILFLFDGRYGISTKDKELLKMFGDKRVIFVATKKDLYGEKRICTEKDFIEISNKTLYGIDLLIKKIMKVAKRDFDKKEIMFIDVKTKEIVDKILKIIKESENSLKKGNEVASTDILKRCLFRFDDIYKTDSLEEVYNSIFKDFCIGK